MNEEKQHATPSHPAIAPALDPVKMMVVVEAITTVAVAHTPSPSDALRALCESVLSVALASGVELNDVGAWFTNIEKSTPVDDTIRQAAREMVTECWRRAQKIRAQASDVRAAVADIDKQRAHEGKCSECGRSMTDHSATSAELLRSTGIVVCREFKTWGAAL